MISAAPSKRKTPTGDPLIIQSEKFFLRISISEFSIGLRRKVCFDLRQDQVECHMPVDPDHHRQEVEVHRFRK